MSGKNIFTFGVGQFNLKTTVVFLQSSTVFLRSPLLLSVAFCFSTAIVVSQERGFSPSDDHDSGSYGNSLVGRHPRLVDGDHDFRALGGPVKPGWTTSAYNNDPFPKPGGAQTVVVDRPN